MDAAAADEIELAQSVESPFGQVDHHIEIAGPHRPVVDVVLRGDLRRRAEWSRDDRFRRNLLRHRFAAVRVVHQITSEPPAAGSPLPTERNGNVPARFVYVAIVAGRAAIPQRTAEEALPSECFLGGRGRVANAVLSGDRVPTRRLQRRRRRCRLRDRISSRYRVAARHVGLVDRILTRCGFRTRDRVAPRGLGCSDGISARNRVAAGNRPLIPSAPGFAAGTSA